MKRNVLFGFLGTTLDVGKGDRRWQRWRPSVAVCQQPELPIHRFELLYPRHAPGLCATVCEDLAQVSPHTEVRSHVTSTTDPWDFESVYAMLHDFFAGYPFDPDNEDYLVHITTGTHVAQICLFLLAESRHVPARLVQSGPGPNKESPVGTVHIIDLDLSRYDQIASRFERETQQRTASLKSGIQTRNAAFNDLATRLEYVAARTSDAILLMGPTGAGKSQMARRVFELKRGAHLLTGSFVDVNCATLRGDTAMSTLFGHRKGAFTGAATERAGLLRAADGGLLFLDEIGELGLDEQAMLLRAIEERRFLPMGSDREVESMFQLIAGTNRDLRAAVAEGRFREDLLARIDLWTFVLPPLRERTEDIEPNLEYELQRYTQRTNRVVRFSREARERYLAFARSPDATWRANFRDLAASVTRMATLAEGDRITESLVDEEIARLREAWDGAAGTGRGDSSSGGPLHALLGADALAQMDRFDRVQLEDVVRVCERSPSLSEAGRELFAASRTRRTAVNDADRLRKYLARFGLSWGAVKGE